MPKPSKPTPVSLFDDQEARRLFDTEERDVVVKVISHCGDQPSMGHVKAHGYRAGLAEKIKERLLPSADAVIGLLLKNDRAGTHEFQAVIKLQIELTELSDRLRASDGQTLSGDDAAQWGQWLYGAWTAFIGEASAVQLPELVAAAAQLPELSVSAAHGKKFKAGRKIGTVGPVRKAIQGVLKKKPTATPKEIWAALKEKPPRGMTFYDNHLGRYIEVDGQAGETKFTSFSNIVSQEKNGK